jgi:hypothetical protein
MTMRYIVRLILLNERSFAMDVVLPSSSDLLRSLAREKLKSGTPNAVGSLFQCMSTTDDRKVNIHKYWNVTLENEFAEAFKKRFEAPQVNGVELTPDVIETSLQRTEGFTNQAWTTMSQFEESCATSLSDVLSHINDPEVTGALSASGTFIPKVEKYFAALENLNELQQGQDSKGKLRLHNF